MKKQNKSESENEIVVKHCKKCHCELSSNNKGMLCPNCRRSAARKVRGILPVAVGVIAIAIPGANKFLKK